MRKMAFEYNGEQIFIDVKSASDCKLISCIGDENQECLFVCGWRPESKKTENNFDHFIEVKQFEIFLKEGRLGKTAGSNGSGIIYDTKHNGFEVKYTS